MAMPTILHRRRISGVTSLSLRAITYYQNGKFIIAGDKGLILVNQPPSFGGAARDAQGNIAFNIIRLSGTTAIIQGASNLNPPNWQSIATNTLVNGTVIFTETPNSAYGFYRAIVQ
jgi:hypothetical protein